MGSPAPSARFRILGPIECYCGEHRLELARRQLTLLAVLLVHSNRPVSNDRLVESLWAGQHSGGTVKRLQVAITRLRKTLDGCANGEPPLQTLSGGYRLAIGPGELDADVFAEQVALGRRALEVGDAARAADVLRGALGLWRGPALTEVTYAPFAQGEIRRLEELRLAALESHLEADLQLGRHDLVAELEGLAAAHPTHEEFTRLLMLALYRGGRQADALDAFQRARVRLAEQVGLEPGPALKAMQAQVLAQESALERPLDVVPGERASLTLLGEQRIVWLDPARQVSLGRGSNLDVDLSSDSKVSRVHALLECIGGAWMLSDDGLSSNGTFCNDERVRSRRRLVDGDTLRLGRTEIVFRDPSHAPHERTVGTGIDI